MCFCDHLQNKELWFSSQLKDIILGSKYSPINLCIQYTIELHESSIDIYLSVALSLQ